MSPPATLPFYSATNWNCSCRVEALKKRFIGDLNSNMGNSIDHYFGPRGEGDDGQELFTLDSQETSNLVFKCVPQRQTLIDNLQTIEFDLCLCCKVNIHRLVIPAHYSTKCQI